MRGHVVLAGVVVVPTLLALRRVLDQDDPLYSALLLMVNALWVAVLLLGAHRTWRRHSRGAPRRPRDDAGDDRGAHTDGEPPATA